MGVSLELALSLRVPCPQVAMGRSSPEDGEGRMTPLMGFSAPSAHAAREIHQHEVPSSLRSAFAVGSALTVYSLSGLADLFHSAALMGFRVESSRVASAFAASSRAVFDRAAGAEPFTAARGRRVEARCEPHPRVGLEPDRAGFPPRWSARAPLRLPLPTDDPKTERERADSA